MSQTKRNISGKYSQPATTIYKYPSPFSSKAFSSRGVNKLITKRHLRADGLSLLPSALRPRLVNYYNSNRNIAKNIALITIFSIFGSFSIFSTVPVSAASITLSIPSNLSLDIMPKSGGSFVKSATQHIGVKTDASNGYTLNITNNTADNNLINNESVIKSIDNVDGITENEFSSLNNFNVWAFLPSKLNGINNDKFLPGPTDSNPITIDKTSTSNSETNNYDITLASKVDETLPAGEYNNKFTITAVADDAKSIVFKTGENIDMIMVADGSKNYKPYYAFPGQDVVLENLTKDTELIVTVVPKAGFKLASWTRDTKDGTLNSEELLTTTYIVENGKETLTANGIEGSYTPMQQVSNNQCVNSPEGGLNVTDIRNNISYTIANIGGYCYMLSNLRLEKGTMLTAEDSDVTINHTLPYTQSNAYQSPQIVECHGPTNDSDNNNCDNNHGITEYYYNGVAANYGVVIHKADSGGEDMWEYFYSYGTICPAGWKLTDYKEDIKVEALWENGKNPARLSLSDQSRTAGNFISELHYDMDGVYFYHSIFDGNSPKVEGEYYGVGSVRCRSRNYKITFEAGPNIEMIIVASKKSNFTPYYATTNKSITINDDLEKGDEIIITVVPKAGAKLTSWTRDTNSGTLNNEELLTTTYTVGDNDETLMANGSNGTYVSMQDFSDCTETGSNVTDQRDLKSYTVKKMGSKCFMLSNLRLSANTHLTSNDSDVTNDFTLPENSWKDSYTVARMIECQGSNGDNTCTNDLGVTEYYYNWYAAKANPNDTELDYKYADSTLDNKSLGSICPKGWKLPQYSSTDINPTTDLYNWQDKNNPAALILSGGLRSGNTISRDGAYYWSSERYTDRYSNYNMYAYYLSLYNGSITRSYRGNKNYGLPIRCML